MKIEKKNEVYIRIETEPHIARELSEYFTFEVPGARFMPSYRNKVWDGKIRLFSIATGQIYLGLLPYIREFCKRNDIRYELDFNTRPEDLDESTIKSFINTLKFHTKLVIIRFLVFFMVPENVVVFLFVLLHLVNR